MTFSGGCKGTTVGELLLLQILKREADEQVRLILGGSSAPYAREPAGLKARGSGYG